MKDVAPHDRPREKLERAGAGMLGDNELLAVLIGHGTAEASALEVANRVLAAAEGLHGLTRVGGDELARLPGVGAALASRIQAAVELGRRTLVRSPAVRVQLRSSHDCASFLLSRYGAHPVERFGVVLLDARHRLIRTQLLTVGAIDATVVDPRDVFRTAMLAGASALVAFHNHPSGDPAPSGEDIRITRRLMQAGDLMGIAVLDHLILTDTRYCSMREAGLSE